MVVGALASFAWGEPRTTQGLDIAVEQGGHDLSAIEGIFVDAGFPADGPFSTHFGPRFIVPFPHGLPLDVFVSDDSAEFDRRREVPVGDVSLHMVSPEDVIISKISNVTDLPGDRQIDLEDACGVLFKRWETIGFDHLEARARSLGLSEEVGTLIDEVRAARKDQDLPV